MAILLPPDHPLHHLAVDSLVDSQRRRETQRPVRIGIINIMPKLEAYEPSLLAPLAESSLLIEPVFLRLSTHGYQSSDHEHLDKFYHPLDRAIAPRPLDGLVLTGAPVEELPFEEVHYWRELEDVLSYARKNVASTLGLCWGALALGKVLGIEKRTFPKKLFGVFEDRVLVRSPDLLGSAGESFVCAHSRHSGAIASELEQAAARGVVRLLSRGEETGYSIFETPDHRFIAHVGHPEYEAERLAFEWTRDRALGRSDVFPPANFDADVPVPVTTWRGHRQTVFTGFLARAARGFASDALSA